MERPMVVASSWGVEAEPAVFFECVVGRRDGRRSAAAAPGTSPPLEPLTSVLYRCVMSLSGARGPLVPRAAWELGLKAALLPLLLASRGPAASISGQMFSLLSMAGQPG